MADLAKNSSYSHASELFQALIKVDNTEAHNKSAEPIKFNSKIACIYPDLFYQMGYDEYMLLNAVYPYYDEHEASFVFKMAGRNPSVDLKNIPHSAWLNLEPKQVVAQHVIFTINTNVTCLLSVQFQRPL